MVTIVLVDVTTSDLNTKLLININKDKPWVSTKDMLVTRSMDRNKPGKVGQWSMERNKPAKVGQ